MFSEIFGFELRYQLRQPVYWVSALFFFLLTFLAVTTDVVVLGGSIGNVNRNAPFVILQLFFVTSLVGTFVTTAFVASTVLRDFDLRTQELFFTTPLRKRDYVFGRFAGALAVSVGIYAFVALAILAGSLMPWLEPERVGPFSLAPYLSAFALLVVPNVFFTAAIFFSLATATRSLMYTYGGLIAIFFGYLLAQNLLSDMENETLASLLDPFGGAAFAIATKYWTVQERNTETLAISGPLLWNRILWMGAALAVLALAYLRFSFTYLGATGRRGRKRLEIVEEGAPAPPPLERAPARAPSITTATRVLQILHRSRMEVTGVLRSAAFPVLLAFGVLNMIGNSTVLDQLFGTPVYPVTHLMVSILQSAFLFVFIIVTIYAGELVWRERSLRVSDYEDALPVPNWIFWGAKLGALLFILAAILVTAILTGVAIQAYRGYFDFELSLYLEGMLLVVGIPFALAAVLALFLQVASNNKYLGFLLMILFFVSGPVLGALDFDHNLYQYASAPDAPYSDMNGYGHFTRPMFWFDLYWSFFAVLLLIGVHLLWPRGSAEGFRTRLAVARDRLTPRVVRVAILAVLFWIATGSFIFYNTNVLNEYVPGDALEARQVRFEKEFKKYEGLPKPRLRSVYAEIDIFPERRAVDIRGRYGLQNRTGAEIDAIHLLLPKRVGVRKLEVPGGKRTTWDEELSYSIYDLDPPLPPGGEIEVTFDLSIENPGFVNGGSNTQVVANGTFINNFSYFPRIGYQRDFELGDPNDRRKHGLPPVQRMPGIDDESARANNYISNEADWLEFEAVVSTSSDQIALAPGYLQREWTDGGRRYFHYKMDAPILGFFAFLSAKWEVARDRWNDVAIEIYYHPRHPYNVKRMIEAVKKSLDYFTREFGPYQHRQVRILEFPRYARFAQSFPNTIPFSESIGFIAKLDQEDEEAIDYVFYVTAHEVAHQWWAHQLIGGFVQGATLLSETLSQYSALMVMEKEYGPEKMRRFLKYELDSYLRGRGGELIEELPLLLVENQPYIHYRKGSVVMYALKDYIGEENVNAALRSYLARNKFQEPPYTNTRELLSFLEEAAPGERRGVIEELFESITLYDNRATAASYERLGDGSYRVRLDLTAKKLRATGQGAETEVGIGDEIDIGVFGAEAEGAPPEGKLLYLEKHRIEASESTIEVVVDEEPKKAGIDPFNKLIDRNPEDNVKEVAPPKS
jgi:ABC-type transport system involved in multi-copper enzyme maturation permease subunit